jgi:hypothetical protein
MARRQASLRRTARAAPAVLIAAVTVVTAGVEPAGAATSTVTVDPSTGVRDGDTVSVTVSEADFTNHSLFQCDAAWLTAPTNAYPEPWGVLQHCTPDAAAAAFTAEPGATTTVEMTARESFTPLLGSGDPVTCGDSPDDCLIVDVDHVLGQFPAGVGGYAPLSIEGTPTLDLAHVPAQTSPWSLTATGGPFRQEPVTLAQCSTSWASAPDPATADGSCGTPVTVTPDAAGAITTSLTVTDPLAARDGSTIPCGFGGCVVVAGYADEPVRAEAALRFATPTFTASPTTELEDGAMIDIAISGVDAPTASIQLCTDLTGVPYPGRFCFGTYDQTMTLTGGAGEIAFPARNGVWGSMDPPMTIDCRYASCYLVATASTGQQIADTIPVTYAPRPTVSLGSSVDGWDEGTVARLRGENLPTSQPAWAIWVCNVLGTSCEQAAIVGNAVGTIDSPVTLTQAPGDTGICRPTCRIDVRPLVGPTLSTSYNAPAASVSVSSETGLVDGQAVTVSGTGILGNYQGRTLLFPTGAWSPVVVCDRTVPEAGATLVEILTKCAVAPGEATVAPVGRTTTNAVSAPARFTATVGGASFDCTAAAGSCVMGLVRWEQDATVTTHLRPLTFAAG